jgi:transcriptional regulator of acetoin/glycerol metabolism
MSALQNADWPENIRQLDLTMLRLLIEAGGASVLTPDLCVDDLADLRPRRKPKPGALHLPEVEEAIARADGNKSKAARLLDVDRTTVYRIIERERGSAIASTWDEV